ncbi:MAG: hypothetical protein BWY79_01646 [Actinobacteria bacterium ADurb.Bin444]|nr:MAG: hypothetical protein BWY79_01646 [Actinobacteria bacterium ADurb.Bin444]
MIQGGGFEPGMSQKPTNAPIHLNAVARHPHLAVSAGQVRDRNEFLLGKKAAAGVIDTHLGGNSRHRLLVVSAQNHGP